MTLQPVMIGIGVILALVYVNYLEGKVESQSAAIETMKVDAASMRGTIAEMETWARSTEAELKKHAETVRTQERAFRVLKQQVATAYDSDKDAKTWGDTRIPDSLLRLLREPSGPNSGHEARNHGDALRK